MPARKEKGGSRNVENLEQFTRKKDFLICVDSDGCAMDTMDYQAFPIALVRVWWKSGI